MEPTHLVLDEPFTGLDDPARRSVLSRLEALSEAGTGILLATHDLRDVLDPADRIVAMRDGAVAVDDSPDRALEALSALEVRVPDA